MADLRPEDKGSIGSIDSIEEFLSNGRGGADLKLQRSVMFIEFFGVFFGTPLRITEWH